MSGVLSSSKRKSIKAHRNRKNIIYQRQKEEAQRQIEEADANKNAKRQKQAKEIMNKWNIYGLDTSHFKKGFSGLFNRVKDMATRFTRKPSRQLVVTQNPMRLNSRVDTMNMMERFDSLPHELQSQIAAYLPTRHVYELSGILKKIAQILDNYDSSDVLTTLTDLHDAIAGLEDTIKDGSFMRQIYDLLEEWRDSWFHDIPNGPLISDSKLIEYHLQYTSSSLVDYLSVHRDDFPEGTVSIREFVHYEGRMPDVKGATFNGIDITKSCAIVELLNFIQLPPHVRMSIIESRQHPSGGRRKRANKTQKRKAIR